MGAFRKKNKEVSHSQKQGGADKLYRTRAKNSGIVAEPKIEICSNAVNELLKLVFFHQYQGKSV